MDNIDYQIFLNIGNSLIDHYDETLYKNTNSVYVESPQKKIKTYLYEKNILESQLRQFKLDHKLLEIRIGDLNDKLYLRNIRYSSVSSFITTNSFLFRHKLIVLIEKYEKISKNINLIKDRIDFIDFNISKIKILGR